MDPTQIVLLVLMIVILIGLGILIYLFLDFSKKTAVKKNDTSELSEKILVNVAQQIGDLKENIAKTFSYSDKQTTEDFIKFSDKMMKSLDEQIEKINKKVDLRLGEGFEQTNKTFTSVVERLAKIDEAQKNIDKLSTEVVSLSDILSDKTARGAFGEVQLKQIFEVIYGENKPEIYEPQFTLSNGSRVDMILHAPEPTGDICIDSKFPLENYRRKYDSNASDLDRKSAAKLFEADVKKHIDDISRKYIISGETALQAIMFIPAEAVFSDIHANHQALNDYGLKKGVLLASPTTLIAMLSIVQTALKDIERTKYSEQIQQELNKLAEEFGRYSQRWDKLKRSVETLSKSAGELDITSTKITKKFKQISKVDKELLDSTMLQIEDEEEND
ncbi:MAG: DNA recombination protein RmuC [Acholeplasmataceae bacterium]|nr:DNA recombination protein RmuC [Acholeplasmataceae bacterium]MDD4203564.1 DNA recombination protein RmuC [Acholeplasmataceae bacterium]MDD4468306.1 DNA recombination protein RmuC [Acholeplasmataceae bacterium]MDD4824400.1 DNA recombination protein RmuC [Acholeplasmataceae bacterium]